MIWVHRNFSTGFDSLSLAELETAGLKQNTYRFFTGDSFDLLSSAFAGFSVEEVIRGESPEEVIRNFPGPIPSPYRLEKLSGTKRAGSLSYAMIAHAYLEGDIRAADPASIILVFSPDRVHWIAGYLKEKKNSILSRLSTVTERTCVSLSAQTALAMVNLAPGEPIIDPCCGTGLLPLASVLLGKETYAADNNYRMIRMARANRDTLNLKLEIPCRDAFEPWMKGGCLVSDFPADRSWMTDIPDLALRLFKAWIPYIDSFCVILPDRFLDLLPEEVNIDRTTGFTAGRSIITGFIKN